MVGRSKVSKSSPKNPYSSGKDAVSHYNKVQVVNLPTDIYNFNNILTKQLKSNHGLMVPIPHIRWRQNTDFLGQ